jgi:hypothetical protein
MTGSSNYITHTTISQLYYTSHQLDLLVSNALPQATAYTASNNSTYINSSFISNVSSSSPSPSPPPPFHYLSSCISSCTWFRCYLKYAEYKRKKVMRETSFMAARLLHKNDNHPSSIPNIPLSYCNNMLSFSSHSTLFLLVLPEMFGIPEKEQEAE